MQTVAASGGNTAVDDCSATPRRTRPRSSTPSRCWPADAAPTRSRTRGPGGEKKFDSGALGVLTWYFMLAERIPAEALAAADGWGGDAYVAFERDGVCVRIDLRRSQPKTRTRCLGAAALGRRPHPAHWRRSSGRPPLRFESCDPDRRPRRPGRLGGCHRARRHPGQPRRRPPALRRAGSVSTLPLRSSGSGVQRETADRPDLRRQRSRRPDPHPAACGRLPLRGQKQYRRVARRPDRSPSRPGTRNRSTSDTTSAGLRPPTSSTRSSGVAASSSSCWLSAVATMSAWCAELAPAGRHQPAAPRCPVPGLARGPRWWPCPPRSRTTSTGADGSASFTASWVRG